MQKLSESVQLDSGLPLVKTIARLLHNEEIKTQQPILRGRQLKSEAVKEKCTVKAQERYKRTKIQFTSQARK